MRGRGGDALAGDLRKNLASFPQWWIVSAMGLGRLKLQDFSRERVASGLKSLSLDLRLRSHGPMPIALCVAACSRSSFPKESSH